VIDALRAQVRAGDDSVEPAEAWRVRAVNAVSLLCAAVCLSLAIGLASGGHWTASGVTLLGAALHGLTPRLLSARRRHLAARATLTVFAPLAVAAFAAALGPESRIAAFLYVLPGFGLLAVGSARYLPLLVFALPLALRGLVSVAWSVGTHRWVSAEIAQATATTALLGTIAGALAVAWILRTETAKERARAISARTETLRTARRLETQTSALRRAQAQSTEAAHRLAVASHRAGMARAASEVLHDAGNALNGVCVAAAECEAEITRIRVDGLGRAAELLARLAPDDPRVAQLADYLEGIEAERRGAVERIQGELDVLDQRCAHITALVHRQLEPLGGLDSQRSVDVAELVEHAVEVGASAKLRLEAELRLEPDLALETDIHSLLAILLNLVGNAADALSEVGRRELFVEARGDADRITFAVEDDGPGVPEALREQIFAGLTTKVDGHGYGLASSAKAADRLGGSLRCVDPRELSGARFELDLPREAPATAR